MFLTNRNHPGFTMWLNSINLLWVRVGVKSLISLREVTVYNLHSFPLIQSFDPFRFQQRFFNLNKFEFFSKRIKQLKRIFYCPSYFLGQLHTVLVKHFTPSQVKGNSNTPFLSTSVTQFNISEERNQWSIPQNPVLLSLTNKFSLLVIMFETLYHKTIIF